MVMLMTYFIVPSTKGVSNLISCVSHCFTRTHTHAHKYIHTHTYNIYIYIYIYIAGRIATSAKVSIEVFFETWMKETTRFELRLPFRSAGFNRGRKDFRGLFKKRERVFAWA